MQTEPITPDPLEVVPDPDTLRVLLADAVRRRELLRSLLRFAVRRANDPPPRPVTQSNTVALTGKGATDDR